MFYFVYPVHCFYDISPQAPTHFILIPTKSIPKLSDADDSEAELLGHFMLVGSKIAKGLGLEQGFRVVINKARQGVQPIHHFHFHFLADRKFNWPPG